MVTRLVTVSVVADKARNIELLGYEFTLEQSVQLLDKGLRSTHKVDKPIHIVLNVPSVLEWCSLRKATTLLIWHHHTLIERTLPRPVGQTRTCTTTLGIINILKEL